MEVLVVAIVFGSVLGMLKMVLDYRAQRNALSSAPSSGLTAGELERLVERAVERAIEPLQDQIDLLEDQVSRPQLLEQPTAKRRADIEDAEVTVQS